MLKVDLNSDLGESFGRYKLGRDEDILPLISSANLACGFHAGDPLSINKAVKMAVDNKVSIGAHPGFPDLQGFGRRKMDISEDEVYTDILYQLGAISAFSKVHGVKLQHVKPHGALYNMASKDRKLSSAICKAIKDFDKNLILLALYGGELYNAGKDMGIPTAGEVFADRAYENDGTLVSRSKEGAMIEDENLAIERVVRMVKDGKVKSIDGIDIDIKADSICVHGDGDKALLFVGKIREALVKEGIEIRSLDEFII